MAEITVRHELDCSIQDYWDKCVFDAAFNKALYLDRLHFGGFESLESKDLGDKRTKKARVEPPLSGIPSAVKKVIGDKLSYLEDGALNKATGRYTCVIIPSAMPEKTKVEAELWCEPSPSGDVNKCVRIVRVKAEVKVFVVGGLVEDKIMHDLKTAYDAEAAFVREWVSK